jgi:hypothetical protein
LRDRGGKNAFAKGLAIYLGGEISMVSVHTLAGYESNFPAFRKTQLAGHKFHNRFELYNSLNSADLSFTMTLARKNAPRFHGWKRESWCVPNKSFLVRELL